MYLKDGREIYESDKFPGYYIEANTGNFCDEDGKLIGGNQDCGDTPGGRGAILEVPDYVYISKTGRQYYPKMTLLANIPIRLEEAEAKGYKPSKGYQTFVARLYREHQRKKQVASIKKAMRQVIKGRRNRK